MRAHKHKPKDTNDSGKAMLGKVVKNPSKCVLKPCHEL